MGNKGTRKNDGIQVDIYGNPVHVLNAKEIYRMVKCGKCGETVKSSKAKLHISFGNRLNICNECLEKTDSQKSVYNTSVNPSKIGGKIGSYGMGLVGLDEDLLIT